MSETQAPELEAAPPAPAETKPAGFDVNTLTLGEVATIEDLSGLSISELSSKSAPKGNLMAAVAFVIKKRENAKYTWGMALTLTMGEVSDLLGLDEDETPKGKRGKKGKKAKAAGPSD